MKYKYFLSIMVLTISIFQSVFALAPKETSQYFNGPTVLNTTNTSAQINLSDKVLSDISKEELSQIYFEYIETYKACIMIYPTPVECLPKKTNPGQISVTLSNLKPNTSYTIKYKKDNTIMCITTPCPPNEFESLAVEFTTKKDSLNETSKITKNLFFGMKDTQVKFLQNFLIQNGFMNGDATGYFGKMTLKAVIQYQKSQNIIPTGFVGKLTRESINSYFQ